MRTLASRRLIPAPAVCVLSRLWIAAVLGLTLAMLLVVRSVEPAAACHKLDHQPLPCLPTELPTLPVLPTLIPDTPTPIPEPPTSTPIPLPSDTPVPLTSTPAVPTATFEPSATLVMPTNTPPPAPPVAPSVDVAPVDTPALATETATATATVDDVCGPRIPFSTSPRPPPPAGAVVTIAPYGFECARPGTTVTYVHSVRNSSAEAQTLNVSTFSAFAWEVRLFRNDGTTPLTDTNGDGRLDVGRLQASAEVAIVVAVTIPSTARQGSHNVVSVFVAETRRGHGPCSSVSNRTMALGTEDGS
jgi:hypothetical protein